MCSVNELGVACAEMTAWCSSLAAEWLGALVALCGAQHYPPHAQHAAPPLYPDLLHHRDLHDAAAHDALAVFTCILVGQLDNHLNILYLYFKLNITIIIIVRRKK